jgi:hypothetical protein
MRKARTAAVRRRELLVMRMARTAAVMRMRELQLCAGANYCRIMNGRLPPSFDSSSAGYRQLPETEVKI